MRVEQGGMMRLRATNVAVERGAQVLFSDLAFTLEAGQGLIVVGPNGAGKTSLLRAVAGLLALSAGDVSWEGGDGIESVGEAAHYLGHADALKAALSARENLEFWAAMLGGNGLSPPDALARVGLAHVLDFPVSTLSAGQKRRVAFARLLVAARPLWLLDEPLTALDAGAQERVVAIIRDHLAGGGLLMAATHTTLDLPNTRRLQLRTAPVPA
jgi:heme exporter protein A